MLDCNFSLKYFVSFCRFFCVFFFVEFYRANKLIPFKSISKVEAHEWEIFLWENDILPLIKLLDSFEMFRIIKKKREKYQTIWIQSTREATKKNSIFPIAFDSFKYCRSNLLLLFIFFFSPTHFGIIIIIQHNKWVCVGGWTELSKQNKFRISTIITNH